RKQNLRNRFSALDPPLQLILFAARQAPGEEIRLLWHHRRRERLELVADHTVGVEEGAQHSVGGERARTADQRLDPGYPGGNTCLPALVAQHQLAPNLACELLLFREEEFELQKIAQSQSLRPTFLRAIGDVVLRGTQQRKLRDRRVHEEVN